MLHFDRGGELKRRFLLTAVQRNRNAQLRLRALQEIAASRDAEAFDQAIDIMGGWPRDERREGVKIMLQALAERRIGRRDQANAWIWRMAEYTRDVHEEYAVQRWPETKRLLGLLVNSSGSAHARNARRLVHASRKEDRRLSAALLAAALAHTPEAEEALRGARTRMARKPAALARELLRNFPKGRRGTKRRRRKTGSAAGAEANGAGGGQQATLALTDTDEAGDDDLDTETETDGERGADENGEAAPSDGEATPSDRQAAPSDREAAPSDHEVDGEPTGDTADATEADTGAEVRDDAAGAPEKQQMQSAISAGEDAPKPARRSRTTTAKPRAKTPAKPRAKAPAKPRTKAPAKRSGTRTKAQVESDADPAATSAQSAPDKGAAAAEGTGDAGAPTGEAAEGRVDQIKRPRRTRSRTRPSHDAEEAA
jgi:hypothetical protein